MNALKTGLYNKLAGTAALISELGSTAVYDKVAPQGQARPYVVFSHAGGGLENLNPSELWNTRFLVKGVSDRSRQAGTIAGHIKTTLHLQTLTVTGYTNMVTFMEQEVDYVETLDNGKAVFHEGAMFRIRLDN